jgi:prevent-host-death family protein
VQISISELKANAGRYVKMADGEDIFITKNGKLIAKLTSAKVDKREAARALIGSLPSDVDFDNLRLERIVGRDADSDRQ